MNLRSLRSTSTLFFSFLLGSLLVGCAGAPTKTMTSEDRASIRTVKVNPDVQMPAEMFFHGRAQSFAAVGGVIGAVAAGQAAEEPSGQIVATLKEKQISLPEIVRAEFQRAANDGGAIEFSDNPAAPDGELVLAVNMYGFGQTQGFSALLYPAMNVSATLKKKDGSIAWQKTEFATPHNAENKYGHEFKDYIADPELLRKTLTNIAGIVGRMLAEDLKKQ